MDVDHLGIRHVLTLWDSFIVLAAYQMGLALFLATYLDSWNLGFSNPWDRLISRVEPPSSSSSSSQRRHPWHRATCFPMVHVAKKRKESEEVVIRTRCHMICGCAVLRMCCVDKWWKSLYASHPTGETDWSTAAFESVYRSKRTTVVRPTWVLFSFWFFSFSYRLKTKSVKNRIS